MRNTPYVNGARSELAWDPSKFRLILLANLTMNEGAKAAGIIQSEIESEVVVLSAGGFTITYQVSEIASREQMDRSLMPAGLERRMSQQELVDLVEYLSALK